ncbi:hypothetical protein ACFQBU_10385 [Jhaorihella thermophila]
MAHTLIGMGIPDEAGLLDGSLGPEQTSSTASAFAPAQHYTPGSGRCSPDAGRLRR